MTMAQSQPQQWLTKSQLAYVNLRSQVLDGRLVPGTVLDQEAVARELGLSTTPVREALRRLEAEGLLQQDAHKAIRVPPLSRRELDDLYSVRLNLDPFAARLGAENATDADRAELMRLAEHESGGSPAEMLANNRQLHRVMYAASGNVVLRELLDGLWDRSDRYRFVLLQDRQSADTAHSEHREMIEAFCTKKVTVLAKVVRTHLLGSYERLQGILE